MIVTEEEKRRFGETTGLPHPSDWEAITAANIRHIHYMADADAFTAGLAAPFVMQSICVCKEDYDESSTRRVETHAQARAILLETAGINEARVINRTYYDNWSRLYWVFAIGEQK